MPLGCRASKGGFKDTPPDDLVAAVLKETLNRTGVKADVSAQAKMQHNRNDVDSKIMTQVPRFPRLQEVGDTLGASFRALHHDSIGDTHDCIMDPCAQLLLCAGCG